MPCNSSVPDPASTAVVTGAAGWLGSNLVARLVNRPVRCLVESGTANGTATRLARPGVEVLEGDVARPETLAALFQGAKGGTVFHCAGVIHPGRGTKQFYAVNVEGTKNVLQAAQQAGVRRFVHVSSNSPIGCNPSATDLFDENAPYNPYMHYGRSKMMAELAVRAAKDIETVIIRPPWFYGPNQPARQTTFFTMIKTGKVPLVGSGENRRSMAYVDNIVQGMLLCESVEAARGQTYWIADKRPYTMNEIVSTIEDVMERHFGVVPARKRMRLPSLASEVAWLADKSLQGLGLYQQKLHVLSEMNKSIACTVAKAERELGYRPEIDLAEGMRRSMQWMKDQGIAF